MFEKQKIAILDVKKEEIIGEAVIRVFATPILDENGIPSSELSTIESSIRSIIGLGLELDQRMKELEEYQKRLDDKINSLAIPDITNKVDKSYLENLIKDFVSEDKINSVLNSLTEKYNSVITELAERINDLEGKKSGAKEKEKELLIKKRQLQILEKAKRLGVDPSDIENI